MTVFKLGNTAVVTTTTTHSFQVDIKINTTVVVLNHGHKCFCRKHLDIIATFDLDLKLCHFPIREFV